MDEVIADFNPKMLAAFNHRFSENLHLSDLQGFTIQQLRPALKEQIEEMIGEPDFFSDLALIKDSQKVIRKLSERYEIFITTAAMEFPGSFNAKFLWLKKHFSFVSSMNIVFCGNKGILHADYLIDDNARHFIKFSGEGILYTAPHNVHLVGYRRVENWQEVAKIFLS